jgi:hypothetical protein
MSHASRKLELSGPQAERQGEPASARPTPTGTPPGVDPFQSVSEFLAQRDSSSPRLTARDLQEFLEKRVNELGPESESDGEDIEGRWAPWQTLLLVLGVAVVFWGGLIWLFLTLVG